MSTKSEVFKIRLNREGFRLTDQRQKILEVIRNASPGEHLSAEDIYQTLSKQGERIGVSTVYRALHLLVDIGLLRELTLTEDRKFYELCDPLSGSHHHLVCTQCGMVEEFENDSILAIGNHEADSRGFSLLDCQFVVHVVCADCLSSRDV